MSPSSLSATVSCPVCADAIGSEPRLCDRCGTPHHKDCWEYVPGCAVFGCEEQARSLPVETWPGAYRLVLRRTFVTSLSATLLQVSVVTFALAAILDIPPSVIPAPLAKALFALFLSTGILGFMGTLIAMGLTALLRFGEGGALLARAKASGDRRLRVGIERRIGTLFGGSPAWYAFLIGAAIGGSQMIKSMWVDGHFDPGKAILSVFVTLFLGVAYGALLLPPLLVASSLVGSQKVLANRVRTLLPKKKNEADEKEVT